MASGVIFDVSTLVHQVPLTLILKYEYQDPQYACDKPDTIDFTLSIKRGTLDEKIEAVTILSTQSINLIFSSIDPLTLCLFACAGKALIKPLIECFNTDIDKYLANLKLKGLTIAVDIATCALACFVQNP